jgi:ribosomal protein S27AE
MSEHLETQSVFCPRCNLVTSLAKGETEAKCGKCGVVVENPFHGQLMECVLCDKKQLSHPRMKTDWRAVSCEVRGKPLTFYACPAHFPPDSARPKEFEAAYTQMFTAIARKTGGRWAV